MASKVTKYLVISSLILICCSNGHPSIAQVNVLTESPVPGAARLAQYLPDLKGKSVGFTVNHSSVVNGKHLLDVMQDNNINISRIFAPEHGFRGDADDGARIDDSIDPKTGAEVISLYGDKRKPAGADLQGIDIMVFDIQDVGVRFYTFISTMHNVMEACAQAGVPVIVLDRPNPNGYYVDGPVLEAPYRSFVGMHEIPVVYGLTIGELAQMINGEGWLEDGIHCDLRVVPCEGYDHTMTFPLPVPTSPNLPNHRSVLLYPSICFFEGTQVSVGRGTSRQFQVLGHPALETGDFSFTPQPNPGSSAPKHNGVVLNGYDLTQISVEEISGWRRINLSWVVTIHEQLHPTRGFYLENNYFDKLAGTARLREQLERGLTEEEIRQAWAADLEQYSEVRSKYLLYRDF